MARKRRKKQLKQEQKVIYALMNVRWHGRSFGCIQKEATSSSQNLRKETRNFVRQNLGQNRLQKFQKIHRRKAVNKRIRITCRKLAAAATTTTRRWWARRRNFNAQGERTQTAKGGETKTETRGCSHGNRAGASDDRAVHAHILP